MRYQRSIERILERDAPPRVIEDDATVRAVMDRCPPRVMNYGYDVDSLKNRGDARGLALLDLLGEQAKDRRAIEIGAGDGMTGVALADAGLDIRLLDLDDWRDDRARRLPFICANASAALPIDDNVFDLCYSFNTFEHLPDPANALREMVRITKPGGVIHLKFGPLYASAWGLHAYQTLPVPYAQWLFSQERIERLLDEAGIHDLGREREELQPLNRWRCADFLKLFRTMDCTIIDSGQTQDLASLWIVSEFPAAFSGRGLTFEDLIVKTLRVTLVSK